MVDPLVTAFGLACLLCAPQSGARSKSKPGASAPKTKVDAVRLRTSNVGYRELESELKLRVPQLKIERHSSSEVGKKTVVFVDVRPARAAARFDVTLVVSDGRAYDRRVEADPDAGDAAPVLARNIANLLLAIEAGTVAPDRADVPIPKPEASVKCPECPPSSTPRLETTADRHPPPTPRIELAPIADFGAVIGLGAPEDTDRFAGFGGSVGIGGRFRKGGFVAARLRLLGRGHPVGDRLLRIRVGLGGGYVWRPQPSHASPFELEASAHVSVEPWFVLRGGSSTDLGVDRPPLVGGFARLAPGYRYAAPSGRLSLRVGAFAELAVSGLASGGLRTGKVSASEGETVVPMFRLGGVELAGGLDFALWFGVGR